MPRNPIISVVVLLLWMFPVGFGFLVLNQQKREIRKSVKQLIYQQLDSNQITIIKLPKKEKMCLEWHHIDEFEYNGRMFDVIDSSFTSDSVIYHCFWDRKESEVNLKIDALAVNFWNHIPEGRGVESSLVDFVKKLYPGGDVLNVIALNNIEKLGFLPFSPSFPSGFLEVSSPPPKFS